MEKKRCLPNVQRLKGQSALVTGANSGIGKAIALSLAGEGAKVAVNYVADEPAAEAVIGEIRKNKGTAINVKADVSSEDQVSAMFEEILKQFGTIDILVNNAGIQRDASLTEMTLAAWQKVIDVNLTGAFLCTREAAREFKRRGIVPEFDERREDPLCQFGARGDTLGAACQLRRFERRYHAAHEVRRAGAGSFRDTGEQHCPGRRQDAHQPVRVGDSRCGKGALEAHSIQACGGSAGHRRGCRVACLGRGGLCKRDDHLC